MKLKYTRIMGTTLEKDLERKVFENIPLRDVQSSWETIFNQFDIIGNGRIPIDSFSRSLQEDNRGVPVHVVQRVITLADTNQDGFITYTEFLKLIESAQTRPIFKSNVQSYVRTFIPRNRRVVEVVDGAYEQEYTCDPPAVTMILLSVVMILIYMYDKIVASDTVSPEAPFFNIFVYSPVKRVEIWRLITYMFIHTNGLHIGGNVCVQIFLGIPLEMVHKWWRILIIYLAGVFSGSIFTSIVDPTVYLAGASGGVYSLLAAHVATIILNWAEMDYPFVQLSAFLILASIDTGNAIYNRYIAEVATETEVAAAHIGGAGAGFLVGMYVLRNLKVHSWERILWWISFVLFNGLLVAAIFWNIFRPSYFLPSALSNDTSGH